jgi:hypothetical protein
MEAGIERTSAARVFIVSADKRNVGGRTGESNIVFYITKTSLKL